MEGYGYAIEGSGYADVRPMRNDRRPIHCGGTSNMVDLNPISI